jgi:hypothetical protein
MLSLTVKKKKTDELHDEASMPRNGQLRSTF